MNTTELLQFAAAIARSIDCLATEYPSDPRFLDWSRELIGDGVRICGDAEPFKQEVWARIRPSTRTLFYKLADSRPSLQASHPIDVQPVARSMRQKTAV